MDNVGYILGSRTMALRAEMNRIADQVANGNTVGFKLEQDIMDEVRLDGGNAGSLAYTHVTATSRDYSPGSYQVTERPLDLAIEGDAFFMVQTPLGARYTRAGNFTVDVNGDLVNKDGYQVMGPGGGITNFAPEDTDISIKDNGLVTVNEGEERGQVGIFSFADPALLERVGGNMFRAEVAPAVSDSSRVLQGIIEQSNVNMISQMTELIETSRGIEHAKQLSDANHEIELDAIRRIASTQ